MAAISTIVGYAAAAASIAGTAVSIDANNKAAKAAEKNKLPDPRIERAKAEAEAAQKTNSLLAQRNKARNASSLLAKPLDSASSAVPALGAAPGKQTLGG